MRGKSDFLAAAALFGLLWGPAMCIVSTQACAVERFRHEFYGLASWYSTVESGKRTASGENLDDNAMTCAAWGWPFGTWLWVEHEGKRIKVRVNDRGPARRLYARGRIIDLTKGAFRKLAPLSEGLIQVRVWPAEERR